MIEWNKFNSDCQITLVSYEPHGVSNHWQLTWTLMKFPSNSYWECKNGGNGRKDQDTTNWRQRASIINSLCFYTYEINMYLYFKALLQIKMTKPADIQVVELKGSAYLTKSLS